jgi:hypothetical protein
VTVVGGAVVDEVGGVGGAVVVGARLLAGVVFDGGAVVERAVLTTGRGPWSLVSWRHPFPEAFVPP